MDMSEELTEFVEENGGYWDGEYSERPISDWKVEVTNGDTRLGYWEWAFNSTQG